ncbi:MAG: hypothetical protein L0387_38240 [Acidobacteria bacterium]|nr:hypothetical protein [Acidobacteriota bacterium]MCI0718645.1 hypothetical protein [Acidobacteriota bacterium]
MRLKMIVLILVLLMGAAASNAQAASYKLEAASALPEGISESLKGILQSEGYKVISDRGSVWCEVWIRKEIANLGKPASPEAKYPALHLGQLLGVMKFNAPGSDYRGQAIKPGLYTLRYCLILQDGNHLGAAPILDFVLLVPATEDTKDPDAVMTTEEIVALSRKASGTNHPAVINLAPPPAAASKATLVKDDLDHWVLTVKSQSKPAADLPIGIIVVGHAEG